MFQIWWRSVHKWLCHNVDWVRYLTWSQTSCQCACVMLWDGGRCAWFVCVQMTKKRRDEGARQVTSRFCCRQRHITWASTGQQSRLDNGWIHRREQCTYVENCHLTTQIRQQPAAVTASCTLQIQPEHTLPLRHHHHATSMAVTADLGLACINKLDL